MQKISISEMRESYGKFSLNEDNCPSNPYELFARWFKDAQEGNEYEPNAFALSTVDAQGIPSSRIVLLKYFDEDGFIFFTNYKSRKGENIEECPHVSMLFWWRTYEQQVRIMGTATKVEREISQEYFNMRPLGSRVGACISPQSQKRSLEEITAAYNKKAEDLGESSYIEVPDYWGGYIIKPHYIEFWQGRPNRLHDRIVYEDSGKEGWSKFRIAP